MHLAPSLGSFHNTVYLVSTNNMCACYAIIKNNSHKNVSSTKSSQPSCVTIDRRLLSVINPHFAVELYFVVHYRDGTANIFMWSPLHTVCLLLLSRLIWILTHLMVRRQMVR